MFGRLDGEMAMGIRRYGFDLWESVRRLSGVGEGI
jgi:hypothetical protein